MNGTLTSLNQLLLSDWLFEIPIYQRGYAWEEDNLRDLWDDLYYLGDREHYFGTILTMKTGQTTEAGLRNFDHFEVIDGQQRLTTTLILLRELISQIKEFGDKEMRAQASELEKSYIGAEPHYKLTIGGEDKFFFHNSILAGTSGAVPKTRAQKRLESAQAFFRDQFDRQREEEGDQYLDFVRKFKSRIDGLQVMLYIVPSNAEAVRMFETVNDRGRPLTNLEKTKSILMYASYLVVDPQILDALLSDLNDHFAEIYKCFQDIEERLGLRDAGEIQRYHHIFFIAKDSHKHMRVLKDLLMGKSREDPEGCERFIRSYASSLRQAFETMQDIAKRKRDGSALGSVIDRLFVVGPVGNLYPLMIAAWQKFGEDSQRQKVFRLFEAFVFRVYRVVRYRRHTGASWLNWLAREVDRNNLTFTDFLRSLRELNLHYVSDDTFRRELSGTHCYGSLGTRTIRYLLAQYENKLRKDAREPLPVDLAEILSSEYQTEHILPQNPAGGLDDEKLAAHQEIVHRLGNLTIASKDWNLSMGNRAFEEKRDRRGESELGDECYRNSILLVQRDLARWEEWNKASIQDRGAAIIDFALERWRIGPPADPEAQAARTSN
ncbi:MAG: DUF262 domain-containing HNH endonuclease family protein [Gammaproteobacteria bacterium]|nr:DUF262 domain-containing HNH endonuclease family protein [Gammaproteobacteria bacterium]